MKICHISTSFIPQKINQQKPRPSSPNFGSKPPPEKKFENNGYQGYGQLFEIIKEVTGIDFKYVPDYSVAMSTEQLHMIADDFLLPRLKEKNKKINSLCDLGCGPGEPAVILADKLKISPKNIVGVDFNPYAGSHLAKGQFEREDIIAYLDKTDKTFDMISLCRPNCFFEYIENYIEAPNLLVSAANCLTDDGCLFAYGENEAMDYITNVCRQRGIKYFSEEYNWDGMKYDKNDDRSYNLQAVLISKSELEKGFSQIFKPPWSRTAQTQ